MDQQLMPIEERFLEVSGLDVDLTKYPIGRDEKSQSKSTRENVVSKGEVFTPLWLVDQMLMQIKDEDFKDPEKTFLDFCAGYGQFAIRILRRKANLLGSKFNIEKFIKENLAFIEIQPSSCFKLMYTFGTDINLAIGSALEVASLPDYLEGIWIQMEGRWEDRTKEAVSEFNGSQGSIEERSSKFDAWVEGLRSNES